MATKKAQQYADQTTKIYYWFCKNIDIIVPTQIIDIILAYYFIIEHFVECGNNWIKFSDERRTIYNPDSNWDTAYGAFEIDCDQKYNKNKIFIWKFDIHNNGQDVVLLVLMKQNENG